MATKKDLNINDIINTTESIKESKIDTQAQTEQLKKTIKSPTVKFKCSSIYAALYPEGLLTTYQGTVIHLPFDNRVVELSEPVAKFVEEKIQRKADKEADKLARYTTKARENLGEEYR